MSRLTQLFSITPVVKIVSSNTSLTTNDIGVPISLVPTTDSNIVTLPDATTMQTSVDTFDINNTANYNVKLNDYAGNRLINLKPFGSATLHLANNSTQGGQWVCSNRRNIDNQADFAIGSNRSISDASTIYKTIAYDSSTIVTFYTNTSNIFSAVAGTVSGDSITYGTPITVFNGTISGEVNATLVSGAIVFGYYNSTQGKVVLSTITVSGTTLSKGSDIVPTFTTNGSVGYWDLCTIDAASGKGIIQYVTGSYANTLAAVFTHTAGNITFGTPATIIDTTTTYGWAGGCRLVGYNGSIAYAGAKFSSGSTYYTRLYKLVISGTTITVTLMTERSDSTSAWDARPALAVHVPSKKLIWYLQSGYFSASGVLYLYTVDEANGNLTTAVNYQDSVETSAQGGGSSGNGTKHCIYFINEFQFIAFKELSGNFIKFYEFNNNIKTISLSSFNSQLSSTYHTTQPAHLGNGVFWGISNSTSLARVQANIPAFKG